MVACHDYLPVWSKYSCESSGWSQNYVFDAVGNRSVNSGYVPATTFTPQTSGSTVPYNTQNHWVAAGYDAAGNMTSVSTQSMTYDAEGRLLTLTDGTSVTDSFTYGGDGRRVTKTSNSVVTTYIYDPNGQLAMYEWDDDVTVPFGASPDYPSLFHWTVRNGN